MKKKELENEAEKKCKLNDQIHRDCFVDGYIKAAEPREKRIAKLEAQIEKMECWHKMDYNDKESCKKIPRGIQLLTEYDCGLFVAYCVNRWTGDHWEEHSYGITRWKEIEEK